MTHDVFCPRGFQPMNAPLEIEDALDVVDRLMSKQALGPRDWAEIARQGERIRLAATRAQGS